MSDIPCGRTGCPNLDEAVKKFGGYWNVPWHKWDAAVADYQRQRREQIHQDRETSWSAFAGSSHSKGKAKR